MLTLLNSDSSFIGDKKRDAILTTTAAALKIEFALFQISSSDSMSFNLSNDDFFLVEF